MKKFLIILTYIFGLLFLCELVLINFFPFEKIEISDLPPVNFQLSENPKLGYELRPGILLNNSDGLLDKEYEVSRKEGVKRILICGDSIAYGIGTQKLEENYSEQLERLLNEKNRRKVEVINLGVPGYGTLQVFERFVEKGLKYKPDIVIYGYWFNDHTQLGCTSDQFPFFSMAKGIIWESYIRLFLKFEELELIRGKLLNSQIFQRLVYLIHLSKKSNVKSLASNSEEADKDIDYFFKKFNSIVSEMENKKVELGFLDDRTPNFKSFSEHFIAFKNFIKLCKENNIRFILLTTPVISEFTDYQYFDLHKYIEEIAQHFEIEHVKTFDFFSKTAYSSFSLPNKKDMCHFNKKGHALVAEVLFNYLLSNSF